MIYSKIAGTGSYTPDKVLTNQDLEKIVDTSDAWIQSRTGIRQRHMRAENQATSDLALIASQRALEAAGVKPSDVDLIIVATTTPDMVFPGTACILQAKLGVSRGPAFDIQAVCTGFVYALAVADKFVRTGASRCALVVGAETFTNLLDWNDRNTCVLFGDGAGAVVLKPDTRHGILSTHLHADGRHVDILSVPGSVCGGKAKGSPTVHMDGGAVFKFAVKVLDQVCREALEANHLAAGDVDWLVPHQANVRIIEATAHKMGIGMDHVVVTVDRHGNTSAASIPLALDVAVRDGRIRPGQLVMLAGVGGGFTWGSALIRM
jgi:3-oxoacyl-[acyl-carrier-protein] synthase-3